MLWKYFLYLLFVLRTDWMIYHWHLFTHDGIYEFVKFLEEQKYHMLFLQDLLWCSSVNRYTSLFFQLYWRLFLLLCLTITILHTHCISWLVTACNWKHVLQMRNPFAWKDIFRGQASLPMMKNSISVPLPWKLTCFGKVDSQFSEKWYKVETEYVPPSLCLP